MTAAVFTHGEYRQLGHQLAGFHSHLCKLNSLLSSAYPWQHPLYKACFSAVEDGLFPFRCQLEILAIQDHPAIDLHYAFHPNGQDDYHQPANLPGCTFAETGQVAESLQRRRLKGKREPLTAHEIAIAVRCYRYITETVIAILDSVQKGENVQPVSSKLSTPVGVIHKALLELQREEQRVTHGQAR